MLEKLNRIIYFLRKQNQDSSWYGARQEIISLTEEKDD